MIQNRLPAAFCLHQSYLCTAHTSAMVDLRVNQGTTLAMVFTSILKLLALEHSQLGCLLLFFLLSTLLSVLVLLQPFFHLRAHPKQVSVASLMNKLRVCLVHSFELFRNPELLPFIPMFSWSFPRESRILTKGELPLNKDIYSHVKWGQAKRIPRIPLQFCLFYRTMPI